MDKTPDLEQFHRLELQGLEREKLRLEIAELQWRKRWKWGLIALWTPFILAILAVAGAWLKGSLDKEKAELSKIRDAYEREQTFARAVAQIGENGGQVIVGTDNGNIYHDITFMPVNQWPGIGSGMSGTHIPESKITRETAKAIATISPIKTLNLSFTDIRDEYFGLMADGPIISRVFLNGTKVTDIGVSFVADISTVEVLNLAGTEITEGALAYLVKLPNLRELSIVNTNIFDVKTAAKHLAKFPNLQTLEVGQNRYDSQPNWKADDQLIREFKDALPHVEIIGLPRPPAA